MADLYPTKTRLALLAEMAADNITSVITDEDGAIWLIDARTFGSSQKVTARVLEMEKAGWVEQGPDGAFWRLTDAGRAVLEAGR